MGLAGLHSDTSETVVIAFAFTRPELTRILEREYRVVKSYDLYVSPDVYRLKSGLTPSSAHGERVTVYHRR